ncbi:MAG: hypothetical protein M4579_002741 [Chaenotheca gracillima]|nr:MAG: hypothetical protein M4579_002741 [Chaenotheca gracillima]
MRRLRMGRPSAPSVKGAVSHGLLALTIGVVLAAVYRYCWLDARDPFKCAALLDQGQWLDTAPKPDTPGRFENWQPPGCLLHDYKKPEIAHCLASKRLVFVGDSTTRQVFWAVARKLDARGANKDKEMASKHEDLVFERDQVKIEFIWDPFLNSTRLHEELVAFRADPRADAGQSPGTSEGAALMLIGGGLWYARHVDLNPLKAFREAVDEIVPFMNETAQRSYSIAESVERRDGSSNFLLFAPVMVPWYESLSPSRQGSITPEKIDNMNDYLQQLSAFQGADVVWSYSLMNTDLQPTYQESGIHVIESVAARKADVLLNLRCNAQAAGPYGEGFPYDRTCCTNYRHPGWVQTSGLLMGLVILPALVLFAGSDQTRARSLSRSTVLSALLTLTLVICYCFYADRTQVFNKVQKQFSFYEFTKYSWITLALGVFSIRRIISPPRKEEGGSGPSLTQQTFLSQDQTDEWKGWMQALILIYHYTGASKILWMYQIVRLLIASYLFMTGFEHTTYFYKTGDYSLRRVASTLIRLNLLSCCLAYMMRTDYLFYYFSSLISFWFVIVYITMRLGHTRNHLFLFALGKIIASAILVTAIARIPGILELAFGILRYTCRIRWDLKEWRSRSLLDMYIVYVGMICALIYLKLSQHQSAGHYHEHGVVSLIRRHLGALRTVFTALAVFILWGYWALTRRSPNEDDYNWWHPFISFLPIISFVILRNCNQYLRHYRSTIFAWLGRCSLETYTLQFHIWLAADTKGLLALDMTGKTFERFLLTAVFVWMSHLVAKATSNITSAIVDGGETTEATGNHDRSKQHSMELPRVKEHDSSDGLLDREGFSESAGKPVKSSYSSKSSGRVATFVARWKESLKFRLGSLLLLMWVLNVMYS